MKRISLLLIILILSGLFTGCHPEAKTQIAATTLPVYEFTARLCKGTSLQVTRLVTENVSCLHDYTLQMNQMRTIAGADVIVISGAGLENFLDDALQSANKTVDASNSVALLCAEFEHNHDHSHSHASDPHIWLSPANAKIMANNICSELLLLYPQYENIIKSNLQTLENDLDALNNYGQAQLSSLSCREIITFHDGFAYMASAFGLTILRSVEEESGSEASAAELIELCNLVRDHNLNAIFTERSGSVSAANIIAKETGVAVFTLDMAMSGHSYFDAMYHNIDTLKEALG